MGAVPPDINLRRGVYPFQKKAPLIPGYCVVGRVRTDGTGCTKFQPGEQVSFLSIYGAEAELINVPEKYLVPLPADIDRKQATALILDWNTAYGMVAHAAQVKAGQKVFVHGLTGAAECWWVMGLTCQVSPGASLVRYSPLGPLNQKKSLAARWGCWNAHDGGLATRDGRR